MSPSDLKSARTALGLSQKRLAERLGVPEVTVYRWERGDFAIAHPTILALALRTLEAEQTP